MDQRSSEDCSLSILKSNLVELEISFHQTCQLAKSTQKKIERLKSQHQLTRQQIEFYTQESQKALEGMKDSNWRITKEMCRELRKLPSPSAIIVDICQKVMLVLNQPEKSFEGFNKLSKNFSYLKDLMTSVQGSTISEDTINEILPIWKNQALIKAKIADKQKCALLLAQWLSSLVEFSLKRETVNSSKRKEPEIQKKLNSKLSEANLAASQLKSLQEKITTARKIIECKIEIENEDMSIEANIIPEGGNRLLRPPSHRTTASEGGVPESFKKSKFSGLIDFGDDELYQDFEMKKESGNIIYEGGKDIGCCRMNFFCL